MNAYRAEENVRLPEIILRPDLQSRFQRGMFAFIAAVGWLIWLYLFAPLLSIIAWFLGVKRFEKYVLFDPNHTLSTLIIYAIIVLVSGALLILWAVYNYLRFRGEDRRTPPAPVTREQLARSFKVDADTVNIAQTSQVVHLGFNTAGDVVSIQQTVRSPLAMTSQPPTAAPPNA